MELDSNILLDIFPGELWMKIFDKSAEKKRFDDIENSINSSPYFHNLLGNKKTTTLFPKVFQVLLPKYENSYKEEYHEHNRPVTQQDNHSESSESDDDEYPHSRPRRKKVDREIFEDKITCSGQAPILKMRQICKLWCNTIDQHYQQLDYHYKMENDYHPVSKGFEDYSDSEDGTSESGDVIEFENEKEEGEEWSKEILNCWEYKDALQFIKHYKNTHPLEASLRNPFIGRSISISEGNPGSLFHDFHNARATQKDYTFWNAITTVLEKYGDQIWFCQLEIRDKFPSRVEYYRQIKQWLVHMPNLKVLEFSYHMRMPDTKYPSATELNLLKFEIDGNPLPKFGNLKFLKTHKVPVPIFNELVKRNCERLKMLEVGKNKCQIGYDICSVQMPNLRQLSIQIGSVKEVVRMSDTRVNWNLEKLYLDIDKEGKYIDWALILKLIKSKCACMLTNLMINLPKARTNSDKIELLKTLSSDDFQMSLLNLKRFKLIISNQTPIDFILPMKNKLEVFEIGFFYKLATRTEDEDELARNCNQILQIVGYEGRLYESNIWELFPKLERIQVWNESSNPVDWKSVDNLYTRDKWEKIRNDLVKQ